MGAASEDGDRRLVGPVVQHALEQVQVGPGGQRVEEALPLEGDPVGDPGAGQELAGPGDRAGEVDQDAPHVGMAAQQRGQHGAGAAPDIHHGADRFPPTGELDVEVRRAVPGRSHERVEVRRDLRVRGEILPERPAEHLLVGGLAGADVVEQRAPGMGHPAADALEIEEAPRIGELLGCVVAGEPSRCWLPEHAVGDQVAQDGVQGIAVAAGRRGQVGDVVVAFGDELGNAQGGGDHQAPGRGQVEHLVEIGIVVRPVI